MTGSSGNLGEIEEMVDQIAPFINNYWGLRDEDRFSPEDVEVLTKQEFMDRQGLSPQNMPQGDFLGTYTEDGQSFLYAAFDNIQEESHEVSQSEMGEELSHIAHQRAGRATKQYLGLSFDSDPEEYEDVLMGDWIVASSVSEMIGRLGGINASIEFGGDLPEKETEIPDTNESELTAEQMYQHIKNKDLISASHYDTWLTATHETGYRTAEKNITEANNDSRLVYKDPKVIWNDYNMEDEFLNSTEKVWGL